MDGEKSPKLGLGVRVAITLVVFFLAQAMFSSVASAVFWNGVAEPGAAATYLPPLVGLVFGLFFARYVWVVLPRK